jgi:tetratricopeptide (TPR) repeat protein
MTKFYSTLIALTLIIISVTQSSNVYAEEPADPRSQASYYIETYGLVDPSSDQAQHTQDIFNKVLLVAESPIGLKPSLKIINSDGKPWAVALPDGSIILSRAALEICYRSVSTETGDARLAFVLGHEIAHLTNGDFWHREIYFAAAGEPDSVSMEKIRHTVRTMAGISNEKGEKDWRDIVKTKELQADDGGFLYASLAGFRTDQIFSKNNDGEDFLNYWVTQTRTLKDEIHLGPQERSDYLQHRFDAISTRVEYFNSGVRLAHLGRIEDAKYFFEEFQKSFPAPQVHNNLGYVYLQLARKHMPAELRYRFWLPTVMENTPPLLVRSRGISGKMPALARKNLDRAIDYLNRANKASPDNLSNNLNLATAYLYSGDFYKAQAILRETAKNSPNDKSIQELKALALYQQDEDIDMWPKAVELLMETDSPSAQYNLAQLYEERGRNEQAKAIRNKLITTSQNLPSEYAAYLCGKLNLKSCETPSTNSANASPPIKMKLQPQGTIDNQKIKKQLAEWSHSNRSMGPLPVDLYTNEEGNSYLAIDYHLVMAVFKNSQIKSTTKLIKKHGTPLEIEPLGASEIWSYGDHWSALIEGERVREIWVSNS